MLRYAIGPAACALLCLAALYAFAEKLKSDEFAALYARKGPSAREVIESPTLYREAVMDGLPVSAEEFSFLLDRPRLSMALARAIDPETDEYDIELRPDGGFHVDDRGRLVGDMELIEAAPGKRVYYISGHWRFVLGITFHGRMVLVPQYEERNLGGGGTVDAKARGYMKIDNALVGFMARVVAYIFPGKVDARIQRFAGSVRKVAHAVHEDPAGMYGVLIGTGKVPADELGAYRAMFMRNGGGGPV